MLDHQSRKILKYIKDHKRASFDEILKRFPNKEHTANILVDLNMKQYTICVGDHDCEKRQAIYELQSKGYGELEEYRRRQLAQIIPIVISILSLLISIVALIR